MLTDSHCLTTECTVCLINTHKQSTNGMEIAMAFRAVHSQGCGEREQIDGVTRRTGPSCGTASVFFLPQTDGCNQRDSPTQITVFNQSARKMICTSPVLWMAWQPTAYYLCQTWQRHDRRDGEPSDTCHSRGLEGWYNCQQGDLLLSYLDLVVHAV